MFGDDSQQVVDNGAPAPMDHGMTSDQGYAPAPMPAQPTEDHHMTPAYPTDDAQSPVAGTPVPATVGDDVVTSSTEDHDLLAIKQDALNALSPLVGNLEQSPEEKFRTTMMLIQASDDRSLVRVAYEAAQAIEDEKSRAQALLDVINEINYFTSHS
jgi:hypothetical protein